MVRESCGSVLRTRSTVSTASPAATRRTGGRPDRRAGSDVIAIREDRSGILWVGTYSHGLLRFDPRTRRFKTYRHDPDDPFSLSSDIVPRLLVDRGGTLWVATADGLNRFDAATERFTVYKLDPRRRSQSYLDLVEDREGALWLGTDSSGLHHFDPATGRFTVYEHHPDRPGNVERQPGELGSFRPRGHDVAGYPGWAEQVRRRRRVRSRSTAGGTDSPATRSAASSRTAAGISG